MGRSDIPYQVDREVAARSRQALHIGRVQHAGFTHAVVAAHVIPVPVFLVGQVVQAGVDGDVLGDFIEAGQVDDAIARRLELLLVPSGAK